MRRSPEPVAFSPGEFAALFSKSQTWGYRQIYAGRVKAITEYGRILIPASEVERILGTAGVYEGLKPKPKKTKAELQSLAPRLKGAWQRYVESRRGKAATERPAPAISKARPTRMWSGTERKSAIERLAGKKPSQRNEAR